MVVADSLTVASLAQETKELTELDEKFKEGKKEREETKLLRTKLSEEREETKLLRTTLSEEREKTKLLQTTLSEEREKTEQLLRNEMDDKIFLDYLEAKYMLKTV